MEDGIIDRHQSSDSFLNSKERSNLRLGLSETPTCAESQLGVIIRFRHVTLRTLASTIPHWLLAAAKPTDIIDGSETPVDSCSCQWRLEALGDRSV
jgi:hypothetical protein